MWHGDCLELMAKIPDNSVDLVLCDLPYNTTGCRWDKQPIDLQKLREHYERIGKINCTYVLTAQKKFTFTLGSFFSDWFRHRWVWKKDKSANFQCAKAMPNAISEDVLILNRSGFMKVWNDRSNKPKGVYNPVMRSGSQGRRDKRIGVESMKSSGMRQIGNSKAKSSNTLLPVNDSSKQRYPVDIIHFPVPYGKKRIHPTQKPVALFEYMIRTYSNEGALVVDNCAGVFTTAVACQNLNRNFIVIEKEKEYFDLGVQRVAANEAREREDVDASGVQLDMFPDSK